MAVEISNVRNSRKSLQWDERDDAQLAILLKRKIKDTSIAIRESTTPYERTRLKSQRAHYKNMLRKVEAGNYNGDIVFNDLRASAALRQEESFASGLHSTMAGGKAYTNTYGAMDFDYESAFRKKRYYGASLPIIMTLLTLVLIAVFIIGMLIPSVISAETSDSIASSTGINLNALIVYHLDENNDVGVKADENGKWWWPKGRYEYDEPVQGEPWTDYDGVVHDEDGEVLYLYADLDCTEIYIDTADIVKAWFKTPMLESTRLDFLEDLSVFQGTSYYYRLFLEGSKRDELIIKKNDEGGYNFGTIYNHIGVYGTIIFLIVLVILSVVLLIQNIVRIFTYTSRRINVITLLTFLTSLFLAILPAFAVCEGTDIATSFSNYFMNLTQPNNFLASEATTLGITLLALFPAAISLVLLILPKLFRNSHKTLPKRIPKGNKIRV